MQQKRPTPTPRWHQCFPAGPAPIPGSPPEMAHSRTLAGPALSLFDAGRAWYGGITLARFWNRRPARNERHRCGRARHWDRLLSESRPNRELMPRRRIQRSGPPSRHEPDGDHRSRCAIDPPNSGVDGTGFNNRILECPNWWQYPNGWLAHPPLERKWRLVPAAHPER